MGYDQSLVVYNPSSTSTALSSPSLSSRSLSLNRVFNAQTGTAIASELLYRILWEILRRLVDSLSKFASNRLDELTAYLDQRAADRQARQLESSSITKKVEENKSNSLGIMEEVGRLGTFEEEKSWRGPACPLSQHGVRNGPRPMGPPQFVRDAMQKWKGQSMVERRDVWMQSLGD